MIDQSARQRLCALFALAAMAPAAPAQSVSHTEANVMVELSFEASRTYDDPFNTITLDVLFTAPNGDELRVPAFWAGGNRWKARYASPVVGTYQFRSDCSQPNDAGLHGVTGKVEVKPYTGQNPLYLHGPIRVAPNRRTLEHADGTPFFWLGDTWWMGLCHRLHWLSRPESGRHAGGRPALVPVQFARFLSVLSTHLYRVLSDHHFVKPRFLLSPGLPGVYYPAIG